MAANNYRLACKLLDVDLAADKRTFEGWGSTFGNVDQGGDVVVPGAFTSTLAEHRARGTLPAMFFQHDPAKIPGRWIGMSETREGLAVKGWLAPTPLGDEVRVLLQSGSIDGLSRAITIGAPGHDC